MVTFTTVHELEEPPAEAGLLRKGSKIEIGSPVICSEITLNSNCDLESQLGFLVEEGKINLGSLL